MATTIITHVKHEEDYPAGYQQERQVVVKLENLVEVVPRHSITASAHQLPVPELHNASAPLLSIAHNFTPDRIAESLHYAPAETIIDAVPRKPGELIGITRDTRKRGELIGITGHTHTNQASGCKETETIVDGAPRKPGELIGSTCDTQTNKASGCKETVGFQPTLVLASQEVVAPRTILLTPKLEDANCIAVDLLRFSVLPESQTQDCRGHAEGSASSLKDASSARSLERRRAVQKAVIRLLQNSRTPRGLGKRAHKRTKDVQCCIGCESGSRKKRSLSHVSRSNINTPSMRSSTVPELQRHTCTKRTQKERRPGCIRESNVILALPAFFPDLERSHAGKGISQSPKVNILDRGRSNPENGSSRQQQSILSRALSVVVSEAGDYGLTANQALQKLVEKGFSPVLKASLLFRTKHIERAMKMKTDLVKLANRRFVLRSSYLARNEKQGQAVVRERRLGTKDNRKEKDFVMENQSENSHRGCTEFLPGDKTQHMERCGRTDGKRWRCSRPAVCGFIYCEQHRRRYNRNSSNVSLSKSTVARGKQQDKNSILKGLCEGVAINGQDEHAAVMEPGQSKHHVFDACAASPSETVAYACQGNYSGGGREHQQAERCHRSDGKGWQCQQQALVGFVYCEHHWNVSQKRKQKHT